MRGVLTRRERCVFGLLINNYDTIDFSKILNISDKTVRNHISYVIQKLGVSSRVCAVIELIKLGEFVI